MSRLFLSLLLAGLPGCPSSRPLGGADAPSTDAPLADAGPSEPDAGAPDAPRPDAPLRSGCFEGSVRVWSSDVEPTARVHVELDALAAFPGGWLLAAHDTVSQRLIVLDGAGHVISEEEAPSFTHTILVEGTSAFVFAGYEVVRYDLDPRGTVRRGSLYVGGPVGRHEGVLAARPRSGGGVRAISHHYDVLASRSRLLLSEIVLDDRAEAGLSQVSSEIEAIPELDPFYADRFFLTDDHVWIVRPTTGRVRDVQLGALSPDFPVAVRIWSDEPWAAPRQLIDLTADRTAAIVTRDVEGRAPALSIEDLPPRTGSIPLPGSDWGPPPGVLDLDDGRVLVVSPPSLFVIDRFSGRALTRPTALDASPSAGFRLARSGEAAAVAFGETVDGGDRHVALRCIDLPAR